MSIRFRRLSRLYLITAAFFLSLGIFISAEAAQKEPVAPEERPMDFILVRNGDCNVSCIQWISAQGAITPGTPKRLKAMLKSLKGKKLPIVLQSVGGDVDAALAMGRMIRAAGLDTAVGRTQLKDCPMLDVRCVEKMVRNGWSEGEVRSVSAYCYSACPFVLAGGTVRAAESGAIGLHQVTNGKKSKEYGTAARRNLDAISTRFDPALKRQLSVYFKEMGLNAEDMFVMIGMAAPDGMYRPGRREILKAGVVTKFSSYSDEPGYVFTPTTPEQPAAAAE
ncbi:MAG: hypothetical protein DI528_05600 [Shinella sp.]|nr:MAG: hypothetical protein DI528_05600 [Shinella sp.]